MPSPGLIKHITEPHGLGVRTDGYVYEGYEIPIYYDPMISKLIVHGNTREEAIARMKRALYEYKITGVKTSIKFLERILEADDFVKGKYDTHFIEDNEQFLMDMDACDETCEDVALLTAFIDYIDKTRKASSATKQECEAQNNWKIVGRRNANLRW